MAGFSLRDCGTLGKVLSLSLLVSSVVTRGVITGPTLQAGCGLRVSRRVRSARTEHSTD